MSNHLYTLTNQGRANAVVAMAINNVNGSLKTIKGSPFKTGGKGSRSTESQSAVWTDGDLLCAVDPGSHSFAVFRRSGDGALTRLNNANVKSGGVAPCSICMSSGLIYVLNEGSSDSKSAPRITVFAIGDDGKISPLKNSTVRLGADESPKQVVVNRQGTVLAVPSSGNSGSVLHCYKINPQASSNAGVLTELQDSPFAIEGASFGFGSAWKADGTTFFMTNAEGDASVLKLKIDGNAGRITELARAKTAGTACWAGLGKGEAKLYVTNGSSLIVFDLAGGKLKQIQSANVSDIADPIVHDLVLVPDGKFIYVIDQRKRRILVYRIGSDGRVKKTSELATGSQTFPLGLAVA